MVLFWCQGIRITAFCIGSRTRISILNEGRQVVMAQPKQTSSPFYTNVEPQSAFQASQIRPYYPQE